MYSILVTEQFREDLDSLDKTMRERVPKTIRLIEENPHHPGLRTHKHVTVSSRTIFRSRVNDGYRLLWEWLPNGNIGLWRVGDHEFIDAFTTLPGSDSIDWDSLEYNSRQFDTLSPVDCRENPESQLLFGHFPRNHLRLFGVPDEQLADVLALTDPEAIWDLPIPENVQYTLYDIILKGIEWTVESFLDTRQLLYRTNVDQLEGYCEGKIKRLLLNLTEEQLSLVRVSASGPILLKGVAGSGKTTIGLYRAQYLAELIGQQRRIFSEDVSVLVLTYTKTLAAALGQLYQELYGELPQTITVDTITHWMMQQLRRNRTFTIATSDQRKTSMHQAQEEVSGALPANDFIAARPVSFFLSEIDEVIHARGLERLEEYQLVNRIGRGVGLDREQHRPTVWQIYELYEEKLAAQNLVDFAALPRLVIKTCHPLPQYDVVIIDEAQDLPPICLRLASKLIVDFDEHRSLTLLADPAQSIYYRGISWKEGGISIRGGRTRTLEKNFRNTQQILEAARHILDGCGDLKLEDEFIPPTSTHRFGPKPVIAQYDKPSEGLIFVVNTIVRLCQSGMYRLGDIAILSRNDDLAFAAVRKLLSKENIPWAHFRDSSFDIFENQVKLLTMHSAKGLEFPVVFIIDLREGVIPYIGSPETEQSDLYQERKLFYVSMTRASERLYMLQPKQDRSRFLRDLTPDTVVTIKL